MEISAPSLLCLDLTVFDLTGCISFLLGDKDGSKVTTVVATPGQGPDRPQEVSYTDTKVIGNGSFGVVYQAKLCDSGELVAIKKVLQDKRFKVKHTHTMHYQLLSSLNAFFSNTSEVERVVVLMNVTE